MRKTHLRRRALLAGLAADLLLQPAQAAMLRPSFKVPDGACDCSHHIYDPRFPYMVNAVLKPPPATVSDYQRLQRRMDTSRDVVVTASSYGTDNTCLLDALAQLGKGARGIAVINANVSETELKKLHSAGVRGVRIMLGLGDPVGADEIEPLSRRIHDMGWNVQIWVPGDQLPALEPILLRIPTPVVFENMGHVPQPLGMRAGAYKTVRKLLDTGRGWVKISGAYIDSKLGAPHFSDTSAIAKSYIAAAPERVLWGSNWPFPGVTIKPDPIAFLNLLAEWVPQEPVRHRILVGNPEALYGFNPADRARAF